MDMRFSLLTLMLVVTIAAVGLAICRQIALSIPELPPMDSTIASAGGLVAFTFVATIAGILFYRS